MHKKILARWGGKEYLIVRVNKYFEVYERLAKLFAVSKNKVKLRGYSEGALPGHAVLLPVYVVASRFCPTSRDVYLKYVLKKEQPPSRFLASGGAKHDVVDALVSAAKKLKDLPNEEAKKKMDALKEEKLRKITEKRELVETGEIELLWDDHTNVVLKNLHLLHNFSTEMMVDGSRIGLSKRLRIDLFHEPTKTIFELKTGRQRDYHWLTTTGYALALESRGQVDVDNACLLYLSFFSKFPVFRTCPHTITERMRKEFIRIRDEKAKIVCDERDPGVPAECSRYCGFYNICHPKKSDKFFTH